MFIFKFYKNLLLNNWSWIKKILILAGVSLGVGLIVPFIFPNFTQLFISSLTDFFKKLTDQAGNSGPVYPNLSLVQVIFEQNFKVAILGLFLGILLGLLPFFATAFNFFVIGLFFSSIAKKNIVAAFTFIALLLPHGIFELPALLISAAFGIKLGLFWRIKDPLNLKQKFVTALKQSVQIVPLITVLLILAAFTEVFVSGRLTELLGSKLSGVISSLTATSTPTATEDFHIHADFKVFINNKPIDFSLDKYQSHTTSTHDAFAHLHDGNGDVVHIHKEGVTLGYFFKTLKMEFTPACFQLDSGKKYCNKGKYLLQLFVNGKPELLMDNYIPKDLDKILITYSNGTKAEEEEELKLVTNKACIYSKTCPERGTPPTESCVKALGVPCR